MPFDSFGTPTHLPTWISAVNLSVIDKLRGTEPLGICLTSFGHMIRYGVRQKTSSQSRCTIEGIWSRLTLDEVLDRLCPQPVSPSIGSGLTIGSR